MRFKPAFWITALLILVVDLQSKSYVFHRLGVEADVESMDKFLRQPGVGRSRLNDGDSKVRLVATLNPGMMWGKFGEYSSLLKVLRLAAVAVILYLLKGFKPDQRVAHVALGGIMGGALGNIHDSLRFPGVRDFLEVDLNITFFHPFPAFNVADSAICVGVAALALGLIRVRSPAQVSERI